ncbi:MAG: hypothetical protein HQM16_07110 [Deltaproteobacteria bacterium]|nr:hypothetical protein [Deltaproteobacteria bacterium]
MSYYLAHPPLQPKFEIASYVESCGFLVPKRLGSLDAAIDTAAPFVMRSEHPQDYAGASGVFDSFAVTPADILQASETPWPNRPAFSTERKQEFLKLLGRRLKGEKFPHFERTVAQLSDENIGALCRYTGTSVDDFLSQASYSYWEMIPGLNINMVADSAVEGRYHIRMENTPGNRFAYVLIEGGRVLASCYYNISADEALTVSTAMFGWYENLRRLDRFDPQHCPLVEAQYYNGAIYFLQYHRTRDFKPAGFTLSRDLEAGEVEALFVRGVTPEEGQIFQTSFYNKTFSTSDGFSHHPCPDTESGSFGGGDSSMFSEVMALRRGAQFNDHKRGFEALLAKIADAHVSRSLLFKPQISVAGDFLLGAPPDFTLAMFDILEEQHKIPRVPIRVVSDGRRAYVKVMDWNPVY